MVTLSSLEELTAVNNAVQEFKKEYPRLFEKLLEMVYLTKALHFKYEYMGALLMDEDLGESAPNFVHSSVLRLYKGEIQKLKDDVEFPALKKVFIQNKHTGYTKICLLVLDLPPESLVGTSYYLLR